jgi:TPP-dependent trihydroxycyclohexane-1,2-dione (THcHDO) dehydratase
MASVGPSERAGSVEVSHPGEMVSTLKEFSRFMHDPDAPGMELPGMDIPGIAASYGVQSERVTTLSDLTSAIKDALSADGPYLIEISEPRLADSLAHPWSRTPFRLEHRRQVRSPPDLRTYRLGVLRKRPV